MPEMLSLTSGFVNVPSAVTPNYSAGIVANLSAIDGAELVATQNGVFCDLGFTTPSVSPTVLRVQLSAGASYLSGSPARVVLDSVRDGSGALVNAAGQTISIPTTGVLGTFSVDLAINPGSSVSADWTVRLTFYVDNSVFIDHLTIEADPEGGGGDTGPGQQRGINGSNFEMYCAL